MDLYQYVVQNPAVLLGALAGVNALFSLQCYSVIKIHRKVNKVLGGRNLNELPYEERDLALIELQAIKTRSPVSRKIIRDQIKKYSEIGASFY